MKMRFTALAAVALATVTLSAGCSKETANTSNNTTTATNAGPSASPTDAKPSPTATPITGNMGSTPTDAFKAYYEAIKAKDAEAVKRMFSKNTMKMLEDDAKRKNKTVDEVFKEGMDEASKEIPAAMPEVRNEKIDGDNATIEIKDEKSGRWETFRLVKEDGAWKVSFGG